MAPKSALLESALVDAAREIFRTDPNNLTVNAVRNYAEGRLGLQTGFYKTGIWKSKSKELITATAKKLLNATEGGERQTPEEGREGESSKKTNKSTKATKNLQAIPNLSVSEIDALGFDDNSVTEAAQPSLGKRKLAKRNIAAHVEDEGGKGRNDLVKRYAGKGEGGDESKPADIDEKGMLSARRKRTKLGEKASKAETTQTIDTDDASNSSSTSVLDDTPPRRKKSMSSKQASAKPATQKGASNSPDEAEIKKLQGQLAKCGVRKIWGFELKRFGDDTKAKIRHLKSMLHDVGMDGRFSLAKAHEIKERRELMADLEEVQEMNRNWGVNGSGRASRSRAAKSLRETSSEEEDEGENGDDERNNEEVVSGRDKNKSKGQGDSNDGVETENGDDDDDGPKVRARTRQVARQADLAFLGSDSESD